MLDALNELQRDSVLLPGHVLLTACPGSGKTRVLTFKIAHELDKIKASKKTIVALTFTNRAADEIKKRIGKMNIESENLWAGTIHAFCLEWILRPYNGYLVELKNGFAICDEYKSEEILSDLKDKYDLEWFTPLSTRMNPDGSFWEPTYPLIIKEYQEILAGMKLIDFDQILYYSYQLLIKYPKIPKILNNLFHQICLDEYQDTSELQYCILAEIIKADKGKTTIFMVGDKDQAIYGSLGGVAKSADDLRAQFGDIELAEAELSGNYRSNQRIIDYYRNFQSTNIDIQSLASHAEEIGQLKFSNQTVHKDNLDTLIANIIQESLNNGVPETEICVLAPRWEVVIPMGRKLKVRLPNVNFDALGLSPLMKNKENIWFKFARLFLVDPAPNMYQTRSRWANELINELEHSGITLFPEIDRKSRMLLRKINSIKSDKIDGLEYLEDSFIKLAHSLDLDINLNNTLRLHWEFFFEGSKKRLERAEFDYAKDVQSFKRVFMNNSGVVVNTCHGIKGEEFQVVIALGLLHGFVPHWAEQKNIDAARKLLYVICSRAKNHLYLISETGRTTRGGHAYQTTGLLRQLNYGYDQ